MGDGRARLGLRALITEGWGGPSPTLSKPSRSYITAPTPPNPTCSTPRIIIAPPRYIASSSGTAELARLPGGQATGLGRTHNKPGTPFKVLEGHCGTGALHYGLTGIWVKNLRPSYLSCFLQCAMVEQALGKCDHHIIRWPTIAHWRKYVKYAAFKFWTHPPVKPQCSVVPEESAPS